MTEEYSTAKLWNQVPSLDHLVIQNSYPFFESFYGVPLRRNCCIFEIRFYKNQLLNEFYSIFLNPYSIEVKPYVRNDVDRAWESAVSGPWVKYFSGAPNWSKKKISIEKPFSKELWKEKKLFLKQSAASRLPSFYRH